MNVAIERGGNYLTVERRPGGGAYIWIADRNGEASITISPQEVADVIEILTPPAWADARFIELRPGSEDIYCMARVDDETWVDQYGETFTETEMIDEFLGVDIRVIA